MLGPKGELLYVGKSVRLRSRLLSYFRSGVRGRTADLVRLTRNITWELLPDEFGTLLREMRLIRTHRPPFNVRHKRETAAIYLELTREAAPRLRRVRGPSPRSGTLFGPYPPSVLSDDALRDLVHTAGLRDCPATTPVEFADQLPLLPPARTRPLCIRGELNSCPAPCAGGCDEEDYRRRVKAVENLLRGLETLPLHPLRTRMKRAAEEENFELAATHRDRLERIQELTAQLHALADELERLDFLYLPDSWGSSPRLYLVRRGAVVMSEQLPEGREAWKACRKGLRGALSRPRPHPSSMDADTGAEVLLTASWFRNRPQELHRTTDPVAWLAEGSGLSPLPAPASR